MNRIRRKEIQEVISKIEELYEQVENIKSDEEDYRDNMPENLWNSVRYEKAEDARTVLEDALDNLSDAMSNLEEACE